MKLHQIANRAERIQASLPPVAPGHIRLWRGNRRTDKIGTANRYSDSLDGISLPFRDAYGGYLTYLDLPIELAQEFVSPGEPNAYFFPDEIAKSAQIVDHLGEPVIPQEYKEPETDTSIPRGWGRI